MKYLVNYRNLTFPAGNNNFNTWGVGFFKLFP